MMKQEKKGAYMAPSIEVFEMESEGVMANSGSFAGNIPNGGSLSRTKYVGHDSGLSYDIEEMVNNLFTIEQ